MTAGILESPPAQREGGADNTSVRAPSCSSTWYALQGGNDLYWRCEAPARAVGGRLNVIPEEGGLYAVTMPNRDSALHWGINLTLEDGTVFTADSPEAWYAATHSGFMVRESDAFFPNHEGAAVWIRPDMVRATLARSMQKHGVRTVYEVDDNYTSAAKHNIFMLANGWNEKGALDHLRAMSTGDAIAYSTTLLRDIYHRAFRKFLGKIKLPESFVCMNNVDAGDWPDRIERDGPLRVGWMGSPSHVWDVDIAWPALLWASRNGAETHMIGYNPANPEFPVTNPKAKSKLSAWRQVGFKHTPWVTPKQYHRLALPLDIGLCPLLTNENTVGKSDVKAVEYTISGAAVIAQNNPVYNRTWVHGETALLVGSPQEMLDATIRLMRDDGLRERLVANAQQYVREERSGDRMRDEWMEAIRG